MPAAFVSEAPKLDIQRLGRKSTTIIPEDPDVCSVGTNAVHSWWFLNSFPCPPKRRSRQTLASSTVENFAGIEQAILSEDKQDARLKYNRGTPVTGSNRTSRLTKTFTKSSSISGIGDVAAPFLDCSDLLNKLVSVSGIVPGDTVAGIFDR
jgi:hypothetical protein